MVESGAEVCTCCSRVVKEPSMALRRLISSSRYIFKHIHTYLKKVWRRVHLYENRYVHNSGLSVRGVMRHEGNLWVIGLTHVGLDGLPGILPDVHFNDRSQEALEGCVICLRQRKNGSQ